MCHDPNRNRAELRWYRCQVSRILRVIATQRRHLLRETVRGPPFGAPSDRPSDCNADHTDPFERARHACRRRRSTATVGRGLKRCVRTPPRWEPSASVRKAIRSTAAADIPQPRIHCRILRADRIAISRAVCFRRWSGGSRRGLCSRRRRGRCCDPIVAGEPGAGIGDRFAFGKLGVRALRQHAKSDNYGKEPHFNPFLAKRNRAHLAMSDDRIRSIGLPISLPAN